MSTIRKVMISAVAALALACPAATADAAQCGSSPGGFEAWKRSFGEEARAQGVGAAAIAALMQTNYASATIAADRSQRSFGLSLDQFLAKRGASAIVARGRSLKQSQGAMFASIQQRYGVPPGPLIATGFMGKPLPMLIGGVLLVAVGISTGQALMVNIAALALMITWRAWSTRRAPWPMVVAALLFALAGLAIGTHGQALGLPRVDLYHLTLAAALLLAAA